jgi:hypothetical protein
MHLPELAAFRRYESWSLWLAKPTLAALRSTDSDSDKCTAME